MVVVQCIALSLPLRYTKHKVAAKVAAKVMRSLAHLTQKEIFAAAWNFGYQEQGRACTGRAGSYSHCLCV